MTAAARQPTISKVGTPEMPPELCHLPLGHLPNTRYPDPRVERLDQRFKRQGNAAIERIAHGLRWAEGPVYFRDGGYL